MGKLSEEVMQMLALVDGYGFPCGACANFRPAEYPRCALDLVIKKPGELCTGYKVHAALDEGGAE